MPTTKWFWRAAASALLLLAVTPASAQETDFVFYGLSFEQFEGRTGIDDADDALGWDGRAFIGNDEWKLSLLSEGEYLTKEDVFEVLEHQLVVQRLASDFFDVKAGVRYDSPFGPNRWYAVVGAHGLAKQWFEVDADLFLSETGDVSARLEFAQELLLTNRIILTPSAEIDLAFDSDPAIGVGSGLVSTEVGARLSYDLIDRAVSLYIGVHCERSFGKTAGFARDEGESVDAIFIVAGLKLLL
jgi:copper resistance protein B